MVRDLTSGAACPLRDGAHPLPAVGACASDDLEARRDTVTPAARCARLGCGRSIRILHSGYSHIAAATAVKSASKLVVLVSVQGEDENAAHARVALAT